MSEPARRVEVVVVGGGPAGAATAWALARNGVDTLIVDRARFPRSKPCAEYLSPQATRIVDEMGALAVLEREGVSKLAGMRIFARDGVTAEGRFAGAHGFRAYADHGLAVRRERLDLALLNCARDAGAAVLEGATVTDVVRDAAGRVAGVVVRGDGETREIRAPFVVGADGLRSVVARRLALARRLRWPERFAFTTHYEGIAEIGDCGEMHVFDGEYCGLADVGNGVTNFGIVVPAAAARAATGDAEAFVTGWIAAHPHLARRFARATRVSPVLATGPFATHARAAHVPGAALVGDAADFYDPFTGEGMYAALRGGELLAPYVVESLRAPASRAHEALEAYDRARRHEFGGKWKLERLTAFAVSQPRLFDRIARRLRERRDLADLMVGVAGDFIPAREVLNLRFALQLLAPSFGT